MASLHKDPRGRSPFYYGAYRLADGTRRFRSTRMKRKSEAWKVCMAWEEAAREAGATDRDIEILNQMRLARGKKPVVVPTIREYFLGWLEANKPPQLSPSTHTRYTSSIRKFLSFLGGDADADLQALSAERIEAFIVHEAEEGLAPKSQNLDLKALRAALGKAFKRGYIKINVANTVDTKPAHSASKKAFSLDQVRRLLDGAPDDEWFGLIYAGYFTGLRLGDISRLKWAQIDMERKNITISPDKRSEKRPRPLLELPIHRDFLFWLKGWRADVKSRSHQPFVFPALSQKSLNGHSGLSDTFIRQMDTAGIPNPPLRKKSSAENGRGRDVKTFGFHSLRKSFNTQLALAKVREEVRMKLADHTSPEVHRLYTEPEWVELSAELSKLPGLFKD
ncbi:hypothetical protein DB345_09805 [Spartobacteria bacterium LR76]|nr:hypothetical protein DB345_09805 [Spartobacteria bacterium LR76]